MGELAVLPGFVLALGAGITIIVDFHGVFHLDVIFLQAIACSTGRYFYKLSLAVRDTTGGGWGAKVILFRAVVKRHGVNFWELLAVVTAVNEFTAAEGEDVHAVIVAVKVVDEFVVIAEVVDSVFTHDLAQDNMVDG